MARAQLTATTTDGEVLSTWETDDSGAHTPDPSETGDTLPSENEAGDGPEETDEPDETSDPNAVREFLAASMDEERKALSKLMKYAAKVQPTLTELQESYENHRARTARLYALATHGLARI
jgi:hypothetical protein